MQYNHRNRLPPPPFGRGGGGAGYPRGHKQLYYAPPPPPPFPPAPPPPERKYEVLLEAGRLAAEYLVTQGVLPPAALPRGAGSSGTWAPHPFPPPLQQQQHEPPGFYGRGRYEDEYTNNPSTRPRRPNSASSSTNSRDDYSKGSYNGRGKRRYGEYRRGYSDSGRDREKVRGRSFPNGRRYEDEDEDGAPGFQRQRQDIQGSDLVMTSVAEAVREETLVATKAVGASDMEDAKLKIVSAIDDVRKDADAVPEVLDETEEGELEDESKVLNSESEVVNQGIDTDVNDSSTVIVMELEPKELSDGKLQDSAPDEEAEDDEKNLDEVALDHNTSDGEVTNVENDMHDGKKILIDYCSFARTPTRPRSVRARRNAATITGPAAAETVDLVSSGQTLQMVIGESANESSLTNFESENREHQLCQENINSVVVCAEPIKPMLQENGTSIVNENMTEEKVDAQSHVVQEYKEQTTLSPFTDAHKESLMQQTSLCPFTASHKDRLSQEDGLMQETDLSNHSDSLIEETELPPLTASYKEDSLSQETELSRTISSNENNLKLQFNEGIQICDVDTLPQDVDSIELSDQRKIVDHELCCNAGAEAVKEDSLSQETELSRIISSHENNLKSQFNEGIQICDVDTLPQDVDSIELSDQRKIVDHELCSNAGAEAVIKMEEGKLNQSSSLNLSDLDLVGHTEVVAIQDNPVLIQSCAAGSSPEPYNKQQEDPQTITGTNASAINDLCQPPLENKDVEVIDIGCGTPIEVGGFDSSRSKNEMVCSSIDSMMDPGIHNDVLPGIQDGYSLAFSDFLGPDMPCYASMQSDLHSGIVANEGITGMDDPIYGSLTDIGFMDMWGQPTQDYDKFF
ncbi:hypothetical protein U9M48_023178 [Paspalum notatum var. saurae]|uniref:Uncharacterized protein n=1 Tax=Paspalum notatum var. saurae TaxID=547442 RepID=A0AAQ3WUV4_PASNO